jgi:hypothetical protein
MKKYRRTNNDLRNITQKTKDQITRTPLKTGGELRCYERESLDVDNTPPYNYHGYYI